MHHTLACSYISEWVLAYDCPVGIQEGRYFSKVLQIFVAVLGEDFTEPSPLEVTFSSGDAVNDTACATFGIVDDDNLEFGHEFTVTLETITPTGPVISMPTSSTVFISDDEGM